MRSLVLLDVALRPSAVAGALDLLPGDAERWIFRDPAFRHRPVKHRPQRVEEVTLRERCIGLFVDYPLHVLAGEQHDMSAVRLGPEHTLVAMRLAKIFKDVSPCAPCLGGEYLEWRSRGVGAVEVGCDERGHGSWKGARCASMH